MTASTVKEHSAIESRHWKASRRAFFAPARYQGLTRLLSVLPAILGSFNFNSAARRRLASSILSQSRRSRKQIQHCVTSRMRFLKSIESLRNHASDLPTICELNPGNSAPAVGHHAYSPAPNEIGEIGPAWSRRVT